MDQITDEERRRIAGLLAEGAPAWRLHQEIGRSRYAIRRAVIALHRPARREAGRSALRLSLAEREEISRGLAAGEAVRAIARRLGRAASTVCPRLREAVERKLELRWSPQQIAAWLALAYPDDPEMRVSHETIYLSLFVQARGALRKRTVPLSAERPGPPPPA